MAKKIFLVFKTHFDIGYTDLSKNVIEKYGTKMLADVVKTCTDTSDTALPFVWSMSAWPLIQSVREDIAPPEVREKAIGLIKQQKIKWLSLPYTTHTEFCGLEEYIRGLLNSADLSHEYGFWPKAAKMTDVPGHTFILPTILAGAGVKFLHLGCNPACTSPDVPRIFWWEGPDGSRVLTFYSKGAYGTMPTPPKDWPYDSWLALIQTNDNVGPQDASVVKTLEHNIKSVLPDAEIYVSGLDEFYDSIITEIVDIPVIKQDLADTWIHGTATYPRETAMLRKNRQRILNNEKLLTVLDLNGKKFDSEISQIDLAFENMLLYGEHTWGINGQMNLSDRIYYDGETFRKLLAEGHYKKMTDSWDEQRERAYVSDKVCGLLEASAAKKIDKSTEAYYYFNSDGITKSRWVDFAGEPANLTDKRNGKIVRQRRYDGKQQIYIENPPSFGFLRFSAINTKPKNKSNIKIKETGQIISIANEYIILKFDKIIGKLIGYYDKSQKKEWIDNDCNDLCYRYDRYGIENLTKFIKDYTFRYYTWILFDLGRAWYPECEHEFYAPEFEDIEINRYIGSVEIRVTYRGAEKSYREYGDAKKIEALYTVFDESKEIKVKYKVTGKLETQYLEAMHFVFPFKLKNGKLLINKLGSLINPATDIVKDANHSIYCLENYCTLTDGEKSMTVISHDIPLLSVGRPKLYEFGREYEKNKPWLYFNAWNNEWGTNFPFWCGGDMEFSFTLFTGNPEETAMDAEILSDISAACRKGNVQEFPSELISAYENKDIKILSFKKARYEDDSYIIRFHEITGKQNKVNIKIKGIKSVVQCDLQERIINNVDLSGESFYIELEKYSIKSFILRF